MKLFHTFKPNWKSRCHSERVLLFEIWGKTKSVAGFKPLAPLKTQPFIYHVCFFVAITSEKCITGA